MPSIYHGGDEVGSLRAQVAIVNNQGCNFALKSPDDNDWEAYVGLREKDGVVTLRVPHGYPTDDKPPVLDVHEKQQILFELTRAVMRFSEAFSDADRSSYDERSTRDGLLKKDGGQSFNFDRKGAALGYTHFTRYKQLIRMLRDPHLLALTKAPGLTAQFDHRHIARNLERAMFLPDGTPVFDISWAMRTQMRHTGNDMVGLACWMALDALEHLFPDSADRGIGSALQAEWDELKHRFADEHELEANASLFSENRSDTLHALQAALEICVRREPPVSADARELHHLLDELLHYAPSGQDGSICSLKGFHHLWESACLEHAIAQHGIDEIFTCDDTFLPDIDQAIRKRWENNRHLVFAKNGIARCPDLVVDQGDGKYLIVDFKYYAVSESYKKFVREGKRPSVSEPPLTPKSPKLLTDDEWSEFSRKYSEFSHTYKAAKDIGSIEAYRWLLIQYAPTKTNEAKVKLELWVPGESRSPEEENKKEQLCWQARDREGKSLGDSTKLNNLILIYKPVREILGAYAEKFHLMD